MLARFREQGTLAAFSRAAMKSARQGDRRLRPLIEGGQSFEDEPRSL